MCNCNESPCTCAQSTTGSPGAASILFVAYASDNAGADFSFTPSDTLKYRAELIKATATPPISTDFAGKWVKYLGDDGTDGDDGDPGDPGVNGTTVINMQNTAVGTDADNLEKTLKTYTVAADELDADGDAIELESVLVIGAKLKGCVVRYYFGAGIPITFGVNDAGFNRYIVTLRIVRTAAGSQSVYFRIVQTPSNGMMPTTLMEVYTTLTADLTASNILKITGQNSDATANTVLAAMFWLKKYNA